MRSNEFMAALPEAVQHFLGHGWHVQRGRLWPWGVQFYFDDPRYHYEISRVPPRLGDRLELGLHFESKNPADNRWLLAGFDARLVEIKASLGDSVVAEPWDRGWTKVYETEPLEAYDDGYLRKIAERMAVIVRLLHPVYQALIEASRKT